MKKEIVDKTLTLFDDQFEDGVVVPYNTVKREYSGIDLFCGIGGFRLAMQDNGVKCVFSSDIDHFAVYGNSKVYHLVIEKCTTFQSGAKLHLI